MITSFEAAIYKKISRLRTMSFSAKTYVIIIIYDKIEKVVDESSHLHKLYYI